MAARSVSELLPRPFAELSLSDVAAIVAAVGEERESLFFERKEKAPPPALAKSCSAFANTSGGLLLVGIADKEDELTGIEGPIPEPQVWVKDVLRGHVLPLLPFRARWLPTTGKRGLLLVLVEESSTTPHLLTRNGAIYVRNPGSSDPVPIQDQRRLLDLLARGEQARTEAVAHARRIASTRAGFNTLVSYTVALAATGISAQFEERLFFEDPDLQMLRATLGSHEDHSRDARFPRWERNAVGVERHIIPNLHPVVPRRLEAVKIWRHGALAFHRGEVDEVAHPDEFVRDVLLDWLRRHLTQGRETLLELGAHGDLRVAYALHAPGRQIGVPTARHVEIPVGQPFEAWGRLDQSEEEDSQIAELLFAEFDRGLGIGPRSET